MVTPEPNPYAPSQAAEAGRIDRRSEDLPLADYTWAEVKKLYYRSCNIQCIAFLMALGIVVLAWIMLGGGAFVRVQASPLLWGVLAFNLVTFIGLLLRTDWGRALGIIACVLMLINIPMGTIIGIVGLFAFLGAAQLFGEGRITHAQAKAAFKARKVLKR
jgi:hypothetical protein